MDGQTAMLKGGALLEAILAGHHFAPGARIVQNNLQPAQRAASPPSAKDHVVEGLANAPAHLLLAMQGGNFGRSLVRA